MIGRISLCLLQFALIAGIALSVAHPVWAGAVVTQSGEPVTTAKPVQKETASDINHQGISLIEAGEFDKALETFNRGLDLFRQADNLEDRANMLANIAYIYSKKSDWSKVREYCTKALVLFKTKGNKAAEASMLNQIGLTFDYVEDYEMAASYYQQAIPLLQAENDRQTRADILLRLGMNFLKLKKTQTLVDLILKEDAFFRSLKNPESEAQALWLVAMAYSLVNREREALPYYEQSLAAWVLAGQRPRQAGVLGLIAGIEANAGNYEKALLHYNESLVIWRSLKDADSLKRQAEHLALMAEFYLSLQDFRKASSCYYDALLIWQSLDNPAGTAGSLESIGRIWSVLGDHAQALSFFEKSLAVWRRINDVKRQANTLLWMGSACQWAGKYQQAADYVNQSLTLNRQINDHVIEADVLRKLGMIYATMLALRIPVRSETEIQDYLDQVLDLIKVIEEPVRKGSMLEQVGLVHSMLGNPGKALDYHRRALEIYRNSENKAEMATALDSIGYCYEQQNQPQQALESYEKSINIRDKLRTSSNVEEIKSGVSGLSANAYKRAAALWLQLGEPARSFELSERARARTLLDQLANLRPKPKQKANAELQREEQALRAAIFNLENRLNPKPENTVSPFDVTSNVLIRNQLAAKKNEYEDLLIRLKLADPEYAALRAADTLKLREVQPLLDKDTTLISYFVTDEQTLIFVITRDFFQAVKVDATEAGLKSDIDWFRQFGDLSDSGAESLKRLYKQLIAPVIKYIKTPVVAIAAHGVLNYLPFAALTDGQHYFGEDHTLYYLPSASIIPFIHKAKVKPQTAPASNKILVAVQSQTDGLTNLGYTEAETVAGLFRTKPLDMGRASKARFLKQAGDYQILHIVAHGEFDSANPLFSRIWLTPGKDDDGSLTVHEVYDLDLLKTDMVVLSACEMQLGAQSRGDDIVGLNRAFIYAGASTVIASLWVVDNQATSLLMSAFYTHLQHGKGKAEALRLAQSETRRKYPNPYYWAAFILTGDAGLSNRR